MKTCVTLTFRDPVNKNHPISYFRNRAKMIKPLFISLLASLGFCKDFEIDVKPGGEVHKIKERVGPMHCHFTYVCNGGTNEAWTLTIEKLENHKYLCSVFRPSGTSYLYMENVKLMGCKKGCSVVGHEAYDNNEILVAWLDRWRQGEESQNPGNLPTSFWYDP